MENRRLTVRVRSVHLHGVFFDFGCLCPYSIFLKGSWHVFPVLILVLLSSSFVEVGCSIWHG